ncbi:MAG: putative bifunctional diguanylate cyclase/phosphodiesterase [Rhizomicrobium sp.]
MTKRFDARSTVSKVLAPFLLLIAVSASAAPAPVPAPPAARAHPGVNFAGHDPLIDLAGAISFQMPDKDGQWFMMTAANQSIRPVTRILVAAEPANAALRIFPARGRPLVRQIASSDPDVSVESARAYGRHIWRVTIPPATTAALAILVENAQSRQPSVQAWTEPAFVSHIRQVSVFMAAVEGLIAAAMLVTAGLALMTGHLAPRWAAVTLLGVFLARLAATGTFDAGWTTAVGGPYGVTAMVAGLTLAAGFRLTDIVVPLDGFIADARRRMRWLLIAIVALSLFAFVGVPGAALLTEFTVLAGTGAITAYLVNRGVAGAQAARVAAPSAAVFSLVATASAVAALGGFEANPMAPVMASGFLAAGAVLLALAIAAGEGIAILPATRSNAVAAAAPAFVPPPIVESPAAPPAKDGSAAALAIGASHQGVFDLDFRADTVTLSPEAAGLIGLKDGELTLAHISWIARIHPDDRETYKQAVTDYRNHPGAAFRVEYRARSESGRYPWFELRATMLGPETGSAAYAARCLGLMADITTRKESEAAAMDRTLRDPLTGLGNRVALMEELERRGLSPLIFALLDIDRFKSIHASLGDDGADAVLGAAAQRLANRFKGRAETFRTGGDSFALIFTDGDADAIGAELVEICKAPYALGGRNVFAPASIGVALGGEARDPLDLLKNAELALIQAKRQGGACARLYSADLAAPEDAVALESELRRALDEKQMDVFYQPIVRLSDATVAGFEALLRWRHPTRGLVVPSEFIAHSEATGLIVALGRFALERAAQDLAQWQRFFPLDPALFVSVNVSRRQLNDPTLEDDLRGVLAHNALQPGSLKLELTESAVGTVEDSHGPLARLRALGAGLAIDDFGTGLSTLSQLRDTPFDTLKVDKSFLARGEVDSDVVLQSIVKMAQELGLSVVVEGVEREQDADRLADLGCEFAQGFFFSGPLPADDALAFIARHYRTEAPRGDAPGEDVSGAAGVDRQA